MLNDGIIKVIGTDAHDTEYRPPSVGKLLNFLRNNYSSRDIHLWLSENPSRIIKGYPVL